MAHHGASRHHRWSRMRRKNQSEECNEENGGGSHQGRGLPVSGFPHRIFISEPEPGDDVAAAEDSSIRKRQQTGSPQTGVPQSDAEQAGVQETGVQKTETQTEAQQTGAEQTGTHETGTQTDGQQTGAPQTQTRQTGIQTGTPQSPTEVMTTVDATDTPTQPTGNPTSLITGTALSQATDPIPSATPPNSTLLSLSIHSPDLSLATSLTSTLLTTDTSSLPNSLTPAIPATSTAAQSSLISPTPPTPPTSTAVSSGSLISRPSSTPTPSTVPSSTRISSSTSSTETSSTTSSTDTSTIFNNSDPTGFFGGVGGAGGSGSTATGTGTSTGPTATGSQPPQDSGPSPTTNKIVGGVVGSVAGVAFIFLVILLYLRRRHAAMREARQGLPSADAGGAAGEGSAAQSAEMVSRRSSNDPLFSAAYFAPSFLKHWRRSNQTTNTDSTLVSNPSEQGFQKISGRKIPSVLQAGGDGYGGGFGEAPPPGTEMSVNFQSPSAVNLRSPNSQPPTANPRGMPLDVNYTRESGESDPGVAVRPSPAMTPAASSTNIPSIRTPSPPRSTLDPQGASSPPGPRRPDILGRSHPSFDGSRSSRFTEGL